MYGGSFNPIHNGHVKCIKMALDMCEELHIIIGDIPNMDDVSIETKMMWFKDVFHEFGDRIILHSLSDDRRDKSDYTLDKWIVDSIKIKNMIGKKLDVVFCGSDYEKRQDNPYLICYPDQKIVYFDREDQISSSEFKMDIESHKDWVPDIVYETYLNLKKSKTKEAVSRC